MVAKVLPNFFTIGNLFLGIVSLILAFNGKWKYAAIMVIIGMLFDGLDGRIARMLNAQSAFGKELDSLADIVTFGVAPAFVMYVAVLFEYGILGWVLTAVFPACGALRLARFNIRQSAAGYFVGLPITAAGGILASMALYSEVVYDPSAFVLGMLGLSYLMVSGIKYPSFKKAGLPKRTYWFGLLVIAVAVILTVRYPYEFPKIVFIPLFCYTVWGLAQGLRRAKSDEPSLKPDTRS